jgi:DNA-binding transcriptional regulator YiaG
MTQPLNHRFDPDALRALRTSSGLTRTQFAAAIERSERTLRGYEQGEVRPSLGAMALMAQVLLCEPGDLTVSGDGGCGASPSSPETAREVPS